MAGTYVGSAMGAIYLNECLAFTSGGFLYFALNGLLNEMKEVKGFMNMIIALLSMALGLYFMFLFALFE